ncbi:MAG: hypothetical protein M1814_004581 [Vezdaea aestivalis]|nr:MAG: hypothetical protein M1814_004581 [Vezdaea aestivalis]
MSESFQSDAPLAMPTKGPIPQARTPPHPVLRPDNLLHSFSNSPSPEIRKRAAFIKQHGYCPHPSHQLTKIPPGSNGLDLNIIQQDRTLPPAHVRFECPDCRIPVYCSEDHWADDYEDHLEVCPVLQEINEDDHDLRSGRPFPEFLYPESQLEEAVVNLTNWDTFLYSRQFMALNEERSLRQATRLLTYPVTIASVLHELSPYNIRKGGRLTAEGLKSMSALRYNLHPPRSGASGDFQKIKPSPPAVRIFVLGARAESSLPRDVWLQLPYMFPRARIHLVFIGPESMINRDDEWPLPERTPLNPFGAIVEDRVSQWLKISTYVDYYHTLHDAGLFYPYDPYFDCFMLFHPGLGHPASAHEWERTLPQLLQTKVPILVTGYTDWDMERDRKWVEKTVGGEYDLLMEPGENRFRSLRWDLNDYDPQDVSAGNWGIWGLRGKRYEATNKDKEDTSPPSKPRPSYYYRHASFSTKICIRPSNLINHGLQIHLDTRPVRDSSKKILTIPKSKPLLAASIALEWDQLTSTQQALKQHLVPMTSIVSRAQDLEEDILNGNTKGRDEIVTMLMRYLNTDTLLCWAPAPKNVESSTRSKDSDQTKLHSLRDIQIATAKPILDFLTTFIWPGVQFEPVTEADTIIPTSQPEATKAIVRGWITGLPPCELAALERAVLAGKGLLGAVRLVVEWSPHWRHLQVDRDRKEPRFGVEEAARAASLEVTWQTDLWGEVEDSHDVDKEDLRRQLGSVVLLLSTAADLIMTDQGVEGHKRSKSSRALAYLHRDKAKDPTEHKDTLSVDGSEAGSSSLSLPQHTVAKSNLSTVTVPSSNKSRDGPISIEQSVRIFRLFEILRGGDTVAVQKGIDDTYPKSAPGENNSPAAPLEGTTLLHLAIQCAEISIVEYVISTITGPSKYTFDLNARDRDGNTSLHIASMLGRTPVVRLLLAQPTVNDSISNYQGRTPLDLARTPEIFEQLQLSKSLYLDATIKEIHSLLAAGNYKALETLLIESRVQSVLDMNGGELVTDSTTSQSGGTLLHEAARKRDNRLIEILLLHGADPFRRDRKGKLPQEVTKDDKTKAMLKKSPAAAVAQRGIQEKAVLGSSQGQAAASVAPGSATDNALAGKEGREMKGYLKKWTNYTGGYKLRWFVLEDGVLSYYKNQDDAGSACRGAINMKIAKLWMDPQDKQRFEILGKSSVKYHLKANHDVEAKRWYWALNNAIQWTKDEAREEVRRKALENDGPRKSRPDQSDAAGREKSTAEASGDTASIHSNRRESRSGRNLAPGSSAVSMGARSARNGNSVAGSLIGDDESTAAFEPSERYAGADLSRLTSNVGTATVEGDLDDDEEFGDDTSSREAKPASKDAFNITAHSAKLQLDLLAQVSAALQVEKAKNPSMPISHPTATQAMISYDSAVRSLKGLVGDLLKISKDRDAYWQYRLEKEGDVRRLWEDNMARLAREHERLEGRIEESEYKRKRTKRALKEALEKPGADNRPLSQGLADTKSSQTVGFKEPVKDSPSSPKSKEPVPGGLRRKSTIAEMTNLSDSDEDDDEEFFDAVDAGEIEVVDEMPLSAKSPPIAAANVHKFEGDAREAKKAAIATAFRGYEDPIRKKLKMDADDRPKISLWGILKSMIGKDMTKMTLPVSFNEPTSLLQRVAEDMEYTDLLDIAADRIDSTERMLYVSAFAASEYASTTGRVAKPFNPLLGETYEYVRPDKGYRFFIEQVSHHPPIGAAYAESPKWDYYGESAVKSKFYGKSFDINPLGTWFLKLRPVSGGEELYTWKKVTSSVVGIITGYPTVDNYGPMEIKNWTTGELCQIDFKARGWRGAGAFEVKGKVLDAEGGQRWSIGGRWNDKIYARLTPGFDAPVTGPTKGADPAFLVWEANARPKGIPFNLTPFVVTLNAVPDTLRPYLPPTDTRLRPDQRAMEDGEYDFAATEKNRVEEKQRATRRQRDETGEEFEPAWFSKGVCEITGEDYWVFNGKYWPAREQAAKTGEWKGISDIF